MTSSFLLFFVQMWTRVGWFNYFALNVLTLYMWIFKRCLFFGIHFSEKSLSKLFCICLPLEKLVNGNTFQSKENLAWFPEKCFPEIFKQKIFSGSCEKFINVILFADYIKFDPQTFDCYIYFVLNIFFSISSLKI